MKLYPRKSYSDYKKEHIPNKGETNCPFCDSEKQAEYTIWEGEFWKIVHNKFPFAGSSKHLLAIPLRCERYTRNLTPEEWADYKNVEIYMKEFYKEEKYYSFIREEWETKSVHHLHYHFLPGELLSEPFEKMLTEQGYEEELIE